MASILAGRTRPVMMELIGPSCDGMAGEAADVEGWSLIVGYEDCREAVAWQCAHLADALSVPVRALDEEATSAVYESLREWPGRPAGVAFKATMTSSQVAAFVAWADQRGFRLLSHAANGIVYGRSDDAGTIDAAEDLAAAAADGGGQITWTTLPPDTDVDIWQPPRGDLPVMRRIKQTFDPQGTFAPGRFVDVM